jgi:hypothetical protein
MEKIVRFIISKIAQISIVGFFTLMYATPLYILFYLIIFRDLDIISTINLKYYLITYFTMFLSYYKWILDSFKKDKKIENQNIT